MRTTADRALKLGMVADIDVILLDVMLPRMDGLSVLQTAARRSSSYAGDHRFRARCGPDIVQGLDSGADDYLTKPFELNMLLARVRAVARRVPAAQPAELTFGDLSLNPGTYQLQRGEPHRLVDAHRVRPLET